MASSAPTHPCYSLPFCATDPNWVWSSDWQAGQTITWTTDEANLFTRIGYKNIPVSIDDAPKAVQGERNVVTTISARSAQRI